MLCRLLGTHSLDPQILKEDRRSCEKIGPCGIGRKALYMGGLLLNRSSYVPVAETVRCFKRLAMSSGAYTGKGSFISLAYLVLVCQDGREFQCRFRREEDVDRFLERMKEIHPNIPTVTEKFEKEQKTIKAQQKESEIEAKKC